MKKVLIVSFACYLVGIILWSIGVKHHWFPGYWKVYLYFGLLGSVYLEYVIIRVYYAIQKEKYRREKNRVARTRAVVKKDNEAKCRDS